MIGTTLSHYKIISKLGQGGMGEVYLAEDSRLDRKVALKILPEHLSERAELRERFEREARAVSSLNHPHICTLYDIGEQDGIHYLVMEHLVGETLEARLAKGPLPLEQTLEYAIQIADALDKAHRQGVVHRDLKPGNIMLVKSGAKLLDFGLAKLQAADTPTNLSALPTEQANLTAEGTILGTLQYMAPEQLEAKEADSRTDIFAFGAVVYEMATGKKAFEGKSQASLIAAIMGQDPRPMSELQPMTPATLDHVVRRCMSKAPEGRWQAASDVMAELRWVTEVGTPVDSLPAVTTPTAWRRAIPWSIAAVAVFVAALALWQLTSPTPTPTPFRKFRLPLAGKLAINPRDSAISPDGKMVAYSQGGQLWIHRLDELEPREMTGASGATQPFWSPNTDFVGYFDEPAAKLKKVAIQGGQPITIGDLPATFLLGATWGSDGTIVFAAESLGLFRVSALGGEAQLLLESDGIASPLFLKDGQLICVIWKDGNSHIIHVLEGTRQNLFEIPQGRVHSLTYSPTGHLVYRKSQAWLFGGGIWAVPFDLETLEATGDPFLVEQEGGGPSVSADGTLIYLSGSNRTALRQLVWVDRDGQVLGPIGQPQHGIADVALSRDGSRVGVSALEDGNADIWIHDVERGTKIRVTTHPDFDFEPTFSPAGDEVAFASDRNGTTDIFIKATDGSGQIRSLATGGESDEGVPDWSRDGEYIVYFVDGPGASFDLGYLSLTDNAKPALLLQTPSHENEPAISPDSRYVAYTSNESGRYEVYVSPFPEGSGRWVVSVNGGMHPKWNGRGDELFYKEADALLVVTVDTRSEFEAGVPQKLFDGDKVDIRLYDDHSPINPVYDVTADGQKFVMLESLEEETSSLVVVLNWFEELKRLVPTN
jgi:serine/threonine protein kinase/WD40 repeat protein